MPAPDTLLLLLLVAVAIAIVLLVLLLLRRPDDALERLRMRIEEALREYQRLFVGESQLQAVHSRRQAALRALEALG